jgi:hypothetical protein
LFSIASSFVELAHIAIASSSSVLCCLSRLSFNISPLKFINENFLYVLPVMPVLPLFSWMLKNGYGYFTSMIMVIILMILLFYLLQKTQ